MQEEAEARGYLWDAIHAHPRSGTRHGDGRLPLWDADEDEALDAYASAVRGEAEERIAALEESGRNVLDYLEMAEPPCDNECLPSCVVCALRALLAGTPKDGE